MTETSTTTDASNLSDRELLERLAAQDSDDIPLADDAECVLQEVDES